MYEQVLKEQLAISYMSQGAVSISDTNDLPIHDRKMLLGELLKARDAKIKKLEQLKEERQMRKNTQSKKR